MSTLTASFPTTDLDELATLQLSVARRADALSRLDGGRHPDRDFWREAELEVWSERLAQRWPEPACA